MTTLVPPPPMHSAWTNSTSRNDPAILVSKLVTRLVSKKYPADSRPSTTLQCHTRSECKRSHAATIRKKSELTVRALCCRTCPQIPPSPAQHNLRHIFACFYNCPGDSPIILLISAPWCLRRIHTLLGAKADGYEKIISGGLHWENAAKRLVGAGSGEQWCCWGGP